MKQGHLYTPSVSGGYKRALWLSWTFFFQLTLNAGPLKGSSLGIRQNTRNKALWSLGVVVGMWCSCRMNAMSYRVQACSYWLLGQQKVVSSWSMYQVPFLSKPISGSHYRLKLTGGNLAVFCHNVEIPPLYRGYLVNPNLFVTLPPGFSKSPLSSQRVFSKSQPFCGDLVNPNLFCALLQGFSKSQPLRHCIQRVLNTCGRVQRRWGFTKHPLSRPRKTFY